MNCFKIKSMSNSIFCYFVILAFILFPFAGNSQGQSIEKVAQQKKCLVPVIVGDYIHIYDPQGDVFPGPDTKDLKAGKLYPLWQPNDHCFIKGHDKLWHAFGITHPASEPGQSRHQGECLSFHAVSPGKTFKSSFSQNSWIDKPKVLPPAERPGESSANHAPTIVKQGNLFKMIYGPIPFRMAVSRDLYDWKPKGPIHINEKYGRDPSLMVWKGTYYLVYCSGNVVKASTSKDLVDWTEPVEIFKGEVETYQCESPTLIRNDGKFYLFWCLWDTANKNGNGYDERSFVYCSNNPLDFHGQPLVTELATHAPEIFQGEDKHWYISSAQYPNRGINVARLVWK